MILTAGMMTHYFDSEQKKTSHRNYHITVHSNPDMLLKFLLFLMEQESLYEVQPFSLSDNSNSLLID